MLLFTMYMPYDSNEKVCIYQSHCLQTLIFKSNKVVVFMSVFNSGKEAMLCTEWLPPSFRKVSFILY